MSLKAINNNNVKIYSISDAARSAIPEWLAKKNQKSLKKDLEFRQRIELIQDFGFPEASLRIKCTRDGKYFMATGVYKPQIRVFELSEMSMKFERHNDCENVAFEILSDDWTKSVHLQADRSIEFHTAGGIHYKTRVPKFGRDLAYHYPSCDLLVGGASSEVYRLNLEQGRFMTSLQTSMPGVNVTRVNPVHQLWAFGGEDGTTEFWDPRYRNCISKLNIPKTLLESNTTSTMEWDKVPEITSIEFAWDGLNLAVGTSSGHVLLYDMRHPLPMVVKDHQYGFPIKNIQFHHNKVLSADSKILKIWEKSDGSAYTSIEPPHDINDVVVYPSSGLLAMTCESPHIQTYYIPSLGPAPSWCPFLDNITEEMEEKDEPTLYDDYKFITKSELSQLNLDHLIGTNLLRAYMHGFFIDLRLYEKAKLISNPFLYTDYKSKTIKSKLEAQRASRISSNMRKLKVNKAQEKLVKSVGNDDRFKALFEDKEYEIDENTDEYRLKHPHEAKLLREKQLRNQGFAKVDESDGSEEENGLSDVEEEHDIRERRSRNDVSSDMDSNSDDEADFKSTKSSTSSKTKQSESISSHRQPKPKANSKQQRRGPQMYELNTAMRGNNKSFSDRLKTEAKELDIIRRNRSGNLTMTFKSTSAGKRGGRGGKGRR